MIMPSVQMISDKVMYMHQIILLFLLKVGENMTCALE